MPNESGQYKTNGSLETYYCAFDCSRFISSFSIFGVCNWSIRLNCNKHPSLLAGPKFLCFDESFAKVWVLKEMEL